MSEKDKKNKKSTPDKFNYINRRKQIRFYPDENSMLEVFFEITGNHKLGILYEEAAQGCSGIFMANPIYQMGREVVIKPGKLNKLKAEIKWVKEIYPRIVRVGFIYKD